MNISDFTVTLDEQLILSYKGEIVRTVSPIHSNTYKFKIDGEEFFFLFEETKIGNTHQRAIYLFPVNIFKDNKIIIK